MCVCLNSDIFRKCESLKMQTGLYVTQWLAYSTPQSIPYTSQPSKFPVCSQIMLSELITPPDPHLLTSPHWQPPHVGPLVFQHQLGISE